MLSNIFFFFFITSRYHELAAKNRLRAPIASMDAMEDMDLLSGSNTHLSKLSSECNIMGGASQLKTTITAGLKYRHIGKTGLKVSNVALGMPFLL